MNALDRLDMFSRQSHRRRLGVHTERPEKTVREVAHRLDGDLREVLIECLLSALSAKAQEVLQRGAHVLDVVLVALNGQLLDGRVRERRERVDDVLDGEERREVHLAQAMEGRGVRVARVLERLRRERGVEGELVDGVPNGAHDALRADAVEVERLVVARTEVEHLERAVHGRARPLRVAEVRVADAQLRERGQAQERGQTQLGAEERVVGDVLVAGDDGDERV